ncbi:universal stress protein [Acidiferrobacter sp.]|uniref:universal stress protein n=1 Tax=Acidiferrobacter sp. TaxID=1872107 RepID=UPI002627B158|nr:universal stress protein [Acidiferrobacter sp.]
MYKNILVAIDGSNTSNLALQEAIKIAKEQAARLRLVHVIDVFPFTTVETGLISDAQLGEVLFKAGQAIIDEARDEAKKAGLEVETALPENLSHKISMVIMDEAKRWGADLVVVGTHGRRGLEHLVLGSVAEGVARAAVLPVLLVPSHH